jgi:multicomponent Na+:H+ antiporter subunit D
MDGIGRLMPFTMFAFLIGSLSIIGLPPLGGMWSKWNLAMGASDAGHGFVVFVLAASSLLNVAYLLPIVARGFFRPVPGSKPGTPTQIKEAPLACVVPLSITAFFCLLLFFYAGEIETLLYQIVADMQAAAAGGTP